MLRGKPPPSSNRSHPLPSGGCCEENFHRPVVATRCQAVDVARKTSTVWRTVATLIVATRCQAVDAARKTTTVWRTVATGGRWMLRGRPPPSGERWLRKAVATGKRWRRRTYRGSTLSFTPAECPLNSGAYMHSMAACPIGYSPACCTRTVYSNTYVPRRK